MRLPLTRRKLGDRPVNRRKRVAVLLVVAIGLILVPSSAVNAAPSNPHSATPINGKVLGTRGSNASNYSGPCDDPGLPPEAYGQGLDGLVGLQPGSNIAEWSTYGQYGTAGQYWNWAHIGCPDVMTKVGNDTANMIFDIAKTVDTVTIGLYVNVASDNMTNWLKGMADHLIAKVGSALQARYLTLVIWIGALALIWWGLFKRRATKVTEGVVWMVCATVALTLLINKPEIFTTAGSTVTSATNEVVNAAIPAGSLTAKSPWGGPYSSSTCIVSNNPQNPQYTGNWSVPNKGKAATAVSVNANTMWSVLVCKPWLQGEFGTSDPNQKVVSDLSYGLLVSQAYSRNDIKQIQAGKKEIKIPDNEKLNQYRGVAQTLENGNRAYPPDASPLFNGNLYLQRIGIGFSALFAAFAAGLLLLLLSLALLIFKLGFLLLLIVGPFFLLLGVHPGWGRVIALRWFELALSTLLKQGLVAGLLSLLLYLYTLIIGNGLPWVLQIILIALVTFAAFFYRKPFQHLFAAVGTDSIGSRILSNATAGTNVFKTGTTPLTAPLIAQHRVNKWTLRKAQPLTNLASATGHPAGMAIGLGSRLATGNATDDDISGRTARLISGATDGSGTGTSRPTAGNRTGTSAPPLNLSRPGEGHPNGPNRPGGPGTTPRGGVRPGGGPTSVGPRPGTPSGNNPVPTGAGWGPRPGEAPPMWKPSSSRGTPPRNSSSPAAPTSPAPTNSDGGSGSRSGAGGWFGSSWRRSGGAAAGPSGPNGPKPPNSGGNNGPRRGGGGGSFGGGSSKRDGGSYDPPPPPRRTEKRDNSPGPAPWRKRESAPPLWAKPTKPPAPDIPFWTRPDK